jgi:hypothetical protein
MNGEPKNYHTMADTITQTSELEVINALSADQIKIPAQPVDVFLQESENLLTWCTADKNTLLAKGLGTYYFDAFPIALTICRDAQAQWASEQKLRSDAAQAWSEQAPDGYDLRNQLLNDFRYAYRKDSELLKSVVLIAEGSTNADMIQDLADLSALGKAHSDELTAIHIDLAKLDTAATLSSTLAGVLAASNGDKKSEKAGLLMRNKAYSHLKEIVDEIRDCGKYTFRDNEARLKGYKSDWEHKRYLKQVASKKEKKEGEKDA